MKKFLSILFQCLVVHCFAQEPAYINYRLSEGLPSLEVYQSIQDEKGYMWFGTDEGLVRFNGYEFKTFTTKDGLGSNVVFGFHKDPKDRIWLYTYEGGISYLEDGQVITPDFNAALTDILRNTIISSMNVSEDGVIWIASKENPMVIKITPPSSIERISMSKNCLGYIHYVDTANIIFGAAKHPGSIFKNHMAIDGKKQECAIDLNPFGEYSDPILNALSTKSDLYIMQEELLLRVRGCTISQYNFLPGRGTMSLYRDKQEALWLGMYKSGTLSFPKGNLKYINDPWLRGFSVSSIYEDREGGFWFTTLDDGIFYAPNLKIKSKVFKGDQSRSYSLTSIYVNDSVIWLGSRSREGLIIKQPAKIPEDHEVVYSGAKVINYFFENEGNLYTGVVRHRDRAIIEKISKRHYILNSCAYIQLADTIWIHGYSFQGKKIAEQIFSLELKKSHITCLAKWDEHLVIGSRKGLFRSSLSSYTSGTPYLFNIKYNIRRLQTLNDHLIIGTQKNGLFIHNKEKTWSITDKNGLLNNSINALVGQNDTTIWVGTNKGLSRIIINYETQQTRIMDISRSQGLLSNKVNDLALHNDTLWVATDQGLSYFNINEFLTYKTKPLAYIEELTVNNISRPISNFQEFDHTHQIFDFTFIGIHYQSGASLKYKYRLKGFDEQWNETFERKVRYMLSPGKYELEVLVRNSSGIWSDKTAISFGILPPFWQRTWFIALLLMSISLGIYILINRRIDRIKEKIALEMKMAQSQLHSLSTQLNPHFVFNTLNSISDFVLKGDHKNSMTYMGKFSRLMRMVFESGSKDMITLEDELKLVRYYVELEQLRLENKLKIKMDITPDLNLYEYMIPPTTLQPFLENAIWHGIMPKEGKGLITVTLFEKMDGIVCIIEDDGLGRHAIHPQKKHSSTQVISKRFSLARQLFRKSFRYTIVDLNDETGKSGTRVTIYIPKL